MMLEESLCSPDALLIGLVMGSDVVHLALGNNTQVDVASRAQVIEDPCGDGIPDQLLGLFLLHRNHINA